MKNFFLLAILIFTNSLANAAGRSGGGSSGNKPFEVRAHFGMNTTSSKTFDDKMETYLRGTPDIKNPKITGLDFTYEVERVLLGIRFELIEFTDSTYAQQAGNGAPIKKIDADLNGGRLGLLLGWRAVKWSKGFIGFTSHYMQVTSMDYTLNAKNTTTNTTETFKFYGSKDSGYGGGLEGGFYVEDKLKAGIEVGYTTFVSNSFTDSTGADLVDSSGNKVSMNLSGPYGKFLVGATF